MKGDFTRRTFDSRNRYQSVLLQQGRVQLDADWNEHVDIQAYLDQVTTTDMMGGHGGPLSGAGLGIADSGGVTSSTTPLPPADLRVTAGRYYVGGVLCENDEAVPLEAQPDLPGVPLPTDEGRYVAYLDVWCEHVTAVERPALREVALGGPDTATRGRTIWQVRLERVSDEVTCGHVGPGWTPGGRPAEGTLRARAQAPSASPDPCVIPATAGFRRLENQLYRVEILDGDHAPDGATFVWSRDNGSVAARLVNIVGDTLTIDAPGRDERLGYAKNDWVEVVDVDRVRRGEPGFLGRLGDVADTELPVVEWRTGPPADLGEVTVVRRWDSDGAVPVVADWIDLEDGVQVEFGGGEGGVGVVRTGDYWLIPARTANLRGEQVDPDLAGDVEWPRESGEPVFQPKAGVSHQFAAVALLQLAADGLWTLVSDCRRLFPPLTELVDVEYAGGDGQEAMPGDPLPQPLAVSVSNGTRPVVGARVRFTVNFDGTLAATAEDLATSTLGEIDTVTGEDGVALCFWRLVADVDQHSQGVTARLLGPGGTLVGPGGAPLAAPVRFSASLSTADQVWYNPGSCDALAGVRTMQDTLDRLVAAQSLAMVGGDGQNGPPGQGLPLPVRVQVRNDCGPVAGATVRFTVQSGAVADKPGDLGGAATTVNITSGQEGVAPCFWRLGPTEPVQVLRAELLAGDEPVEQPTRLTFTANLRAGGGQRPGMHVTDVILLVGNQPLRNDTFIRPNDLVEGVAVRLDGPPIKAMVDGKPVLTLTLAIPYPFNPLDREVWGNDVFGTTPLTLAGTVTAAGEAVVWSPNNATQVFLRQRLFDRMEQFGRGDRVLCHLTLTGRAIANSEGADRRVVNGLTLGRRRGNGGTDMELPSTDDVTGADFTLWFWLARTIIDLVLVPTRAGLLRLKTARDAVNLATPRTELQANLPFGIRVAPGEPDLDAARRAADRAFRDRPERRLVFIVDERYADATSLLRDSLGQLDIELELIPAADPAAAAQARLDAGEPLDAVLTDGASVPLIVERSGFTEVIPL